MRRAALYLLLSLPILGCGGKTADEKTPDADPQDKQSAASPVEVTRQFMDASAKGDVAAIKKVVTEKSRKFIETEGAPNSPKDYTLGKAVVDGEKARVPVEEKNKQSGLTPEVLLKREQGQWRVYGVSFGPFTMNFEEPEKKSFKLDAKATGKAFDDSFGSFGDEDKPPAPPPVKSLSIEDFNRSWKSDYRYPNRPAREVLAELAKRGGMKLVEVFRPLKQLDKPVSLDLKDVSLAQAIEEVCRQAGVHAELRPVFRSKSTLAVEPGARSQPPVYAGPFAVAIDSLDVAAKYATGELKLAVAAYDLPAAVRQMRKEMRGPVLKIDKLAASNGRDVRQQQSMSSLYDGSQVIIPLKDLLRDVETITLTGKVSLPVPVEVKQLRFTELKPGETKSVADVTVTLKNSKSETLTMLQLEYLKPGSGNIQFTPLDAAGKPLRGWGSGSFTIGSRVSREVTVNGRAASLKAELGGKAVTFKSLKAGQTQQVDGTEITLKKVRFTGRHALTVEFTNAELKRIFITGLDADGQPLHSEGGFGFSSGKIGQIGKTVLGSPKEVVVSVVTRLENVNYDVTLKEIPVPNAGQRPLKLAPLQFTGDAPVSLESLGFSKDRNFAKVKLRVKNHSNKDIRRVEMRLHYLDAAGKELKSWPAQADGSFNSRGGRQPVVKEKGTADLEVTAFFMPEGTKRVTAELQEVECADATGWKAKKKN
jgi:hypothetical protein